MNSGVTQEEKIDKLIICLKVDSVTNLQIELTVALDI
jgi:hypothetical protein